MYKEEDQLKVSKTINLSLGGAKIISEKPLPASRLLEVVLVLAKKPDPYRQNRLLEKAERKPQPFIPA